MAEIIRMPRMSDTMEEGNIVGWMVEEGATVEAGDTLAEIETDKATMDFDSPSDGVLHHIAIKEGAVPIGGIIAVIGEEGEDWQSLLKEAEAGADAASSEPAANAEAPSTETSTSHASDASTSEGSRVKASPLAKSMAKEAGISLTDVNGSGDHGRIVKRDIEAFLAGNGAKAQPAVAAPQVIAAPVAPQAAPAQKPAPEPPQVPQFFGGGDANFEDIRVSQMRKTIARRLAESKFNAPHFYLTIEINMDKAIQMRKRVNEVAPTKISFNDFVIKAVAASLRKHPAINASWMGDSIRMNNDINVGVAVAIDEGLMVPVVRYADMKTLSQINVEVKALAGKARDRKLQPQEMQGNTFTISNLGMFGIEEFTAIINPPDSCILAVGAIKEKAVVENGEIKVGSRMKVTLSCDHRVVDGAKGSQFLQTLQAILEDPVRLLV